MSDFSEPSEKSAATPPRLLDQVRDRLRVKHYSLRTEQAYVGWIKRYIIFHHKRHPAEMGKQELALAGSGFCCFVWAWEHRGQAQRPRPRLC